MGLVKGGEGAYIKREPRFLRPTETGAGTARFAPPSTRLPTPLIFDPVSVAPDTGSTAIWRQTPEAGRVPARRARSKADATWLIPPFTLAGVMRRADARRVAVQKLYILIPLDFQGKSGIHGPLRTYPELFALMGGKVPDLRGLFLRGYGSQSYAQNNGSAIGVTSTTHSSGELGQVQGDAIRNITGTGGRFKSIQDYSFSGAIQLKSSTGGSHDTDEGIGPSSFSFDASLVVPTDSENRPANVAVRYLIRARP